VSRHLSDEWIEALDAAANSEAVKAAARCITGDVVVANDISDGSGFHLEISQGSVRVRRGVPASSTVVFHQDRKTAHAIAAGEINAHVAFTLGLVHLQGSAAALATARPVLRALDDAWQPVRAQTTYDDA